MSTTTDTTQVTYEVTFTITAPSGFVPSSADLASYFFELNPQVVISGVSIIKQ